jgi:hypothetical protein
MLTTCNKPLSRFTYNCSVRATRSSRIEPLWNKKLRTKTRRLFNVAKRTGHWDIYKEALISYKKEIRRAKRSSWMRYCQEISHIKAVPES